MSLDHCLSSLSAAGKIDPGREDQARKIYEEIRAQLGDDLGADDAAARATERTLDRLKAEAAEKRRQTLLQAARQREIEQNLRRYRTTDGQEDWSAAATAHLGADGVATFSNVEARERAVLGMAHQGMTDTLATFRRDLLGRVRQDAKLDNVVRASFGESVDDASARELAKAWGDTAEMLRQRFNAAGGHIPKRKGWGLPQSHDMVAVRKAGYDQWRVDVRPDLDASRMYNQLTGRPMAPAELERHLRGVYDSISTNGWSGVEPNSLAINGKVGNRRDDPRFLAFKDADAWMRYHGKYSQGTPFDVMIEHVRGMSRDIAAMETLGPNPNATLRWLEQMIQKHAAERDAKTGNGAQTRKAKNATRMLRDMYAHLSGRTSSPVDNVWAERLGTARTLLTSAQLGSASLSAVSDLHFQQAAARFAGLPVTGVLKNYLKLLRPTVTEDQRIAVRLGLIAEGWSTRALGQARFADAVSGPEFARRLSDFTMRASGLSPWTQAGKWAFGMEFLGTLGDRRKVAFDALPKGFRGVLSRYGINSAEWDLIRATPLYEAKKGAMFLRPSDIAGRTDIPNGVANDLATRVLEMVQAETAYAVPEGNVRGRAALYSDLPPGTMAGEVMRSVGQYKGFAVTLLGSHIRRAMAEKGLLSRAGYAANMAIGTTLFGALAMQFKNVSKGKDPIPMGGTAEDKANFWAAASLQGGGLGLLGDFAFGGQNRYGNSMADTLAGPLVSAASDIKNATIGNAQAAAAGDKQNFGGSAISLAEKYTPGGSLWYARLAYQRLLLDQLRKMIDPNYQKHFHAMETRARHDMGQDFWWHPGETAPDRAPSVH